MIERLAMDWQRCGLRTDDIVLIHSNLRRILLRHRSLTPEAVLRSFMHAVGPGGTVVLPLFNYGFATGAPFDIRNTPSQMGVMTEIARKYPNAVRSGHPIFSFAAIGRHAERFRVDNVSAFGADSPFAILRELNAKIGVVDLPDVSSMTFCHHAEEMHAVSYRYHKQFRGSYTDANGAVTQRTYSFYVRDVEAGVVTDVERMSELLWERGLYRGDRPRESSGFRTIEANALYDSISEVIQAGLARGYLYSIDPPKV